MADCSEETRKQLVMVARRKELRFVPRSPEMPCDWRPHNVISPKTGMFFESISAWHYIADLAESGHPIEEIELEQPKGEKGLVMIVESDPRTKLYIKVQLKGGRVFGRSFHYSTQ